VTKPSAILEEALAGRARIVPWTVQQYHFAIENGMIPEDTATELIDGFIVHKDRAAAGEDPMTIGDRHSLVVQRLVRLARAFDPHGCHLRVQQPIAISATDEPEPDAAVVAGTEDDYSDHKPAAGDTYSVVEVSDSSLARDLSAKAKIYASAGVNQYVVVDLVNNVVIVHEQPSGDSFSLTRKLAKGDTVSIRAASGIVDVSVDRLLP
jgi:Uma2 family endonuclease